VSQNRSKTSTRGQKKGVEPGRIGLAIIIIIALPVIGFRLQNIRPEDAGSVEMDAAEAERYEAYGFLTTSGGAILDFHDDTGRFPMTLTELVPAYLDQEMITYSHAKGVIYEKDRRRGFRLYFADRSDEIGRYVATVDGILRKRPRPH
jgi:hypothetical protein